MNTLKLSAEHLRKIAAATGLDGIANEILAVADELERAQPGVPVTCGNGCSCLAQCGDTYAHAGLPKPPETEKAATATAVPQGWRFKRNADDSIGIFAPPPKPGESQRTSHAVYPGQNRDLHELLGKLADQQATTPAPAPAQEVASAFTTALDIRLAQGWNLTGNAIPVLYTDTINDYQVRRDDVWLCTTDALRTEQDVGLTNRQFDLICQAIDKADTVTMDGDYMLDSDDCVGVVRVMQVLFDIAALRARGQQS